MLKRTTTTEFKPKKFSLRGSLKQAGLGGADTRHKTTVNLTIKTEEVSVQEGPSQRQPPELGVNEQYFKQPARKQLCFCSCKHLYIRIMCCKFSIINNHFQSTLSLPPNSALQWVQENLVSNSPPEHSSSTDHLCMALTNWKQITSDPWVLEAIQGYKIKSWKQPIQACPPAPLHLSQKEAKTSDKLVPTQLVCHLGTLQDGRHPSSRAPDPGGGLDGKSRPQGCIFFSPNSQGPSAMTMFSLARPELPVLLPSIWPVLSSLHVFKDHAPNSGLAEATGSKIDCLHRQLSPFSSLQGGSPYTSSTHDHCIASIGFLDQQQEIHPNILPGNRILRSDSSLSPP